MIKFIYYLLWLVVAITSLLRVINIKKIMSNYFERMKKREDGESDSMINYLSIMHVILVVGFFLNLAGLFTYNWVIHLGFFLMIIPLDIFFKKILLVKSIPQTYVENYVPPQNLIITNTFYGFYFFLVGMFVVLNSYHLHIDLYELVKNFIVGG